MTVAVESEQNTHSRYVQELPTHRSAKQLATIQSWAVVEDIASQRFAALESGKRLRGHVYGLEHLPYAKIAYTSPILSVDWAHGLVETRNTIYRLGEVSEEYESWWVGTR